MYICNCRYLVHCLRLECQRITSQQFQVQPAVELRFCPWLILCSNIELGGLTRALLYVPIMWTHRVARPKVSLRWQDLRLNTRTQTTLEGYGFATRHPCRTLRTQVSVHVYIHMYLISCSEYILKVVHMLSYYEEAQAHNLYSNTLFSSVVQTYASLICSRFRYCVPRSMQPDTNRRSHQSL